MQISLRRWAPSNISPPKRAFEKYKPQGLFSAFYSIPWQYETIITALRICRNVGFCHWRTITIYQETITNSSKMNPFLENCKIVWLPTNRLLTFISPCWTLLCSAKQMVPMQGGPALIKISLLQICITMSCSVTWSDWATK